MKPFSKIALSCILCMNTLTAAITSWNVPSGDWNIPGNWDNGVPTAADDARINNGGTAQLITSSGTAQSLILGAAAGQSGSLLVDANTLSVGPFFNITVGNQGSGAMTVQNGGIVNGVSLNLSLNSGGTGSLVVTDNGSLINLSNGFGSGPPGSSATILISNGGKIKADFSNFGNGSTSFTVTGVGSIADFSAGITTCTTTIIENGGRLLTGGRDIIKSCG